MDASVSSPTADVRREKSVNPWGRGQMASLDGWRALSILMVLGDHCVHTYDFPVRWRATFGWLFDGDLGVRCFFVISGFLITTLMLREAAVLGKLDLKGFYQRRAVRILPVYAAFLIALAFLQWFTAFREQPHQWLHLLTFTANFSSIGTWLTGHTWSLSCEEQFYLMWPTLFAVLGLLRPRRRASFCFVLVVALCPLCRVASYLHVFPGNPLFIPFSLLNYLDSLAIGCLLAYIHPWIGRIVASSSARLAIVIGLACVILPYIFAHALILGIFTVPLGPLTEALGMALLMSLSVHRADWGLFRVLNLRPMVWLGQLSYSVYLWQQIFCADPGRFGWESPWFQSFYLWIPAALAVASASYYLLERPLLALRKRLHKSRVL